MSINMQPILRLAEFTEDWQTFIERDGIKPAIGRIAADLVKLPYRHLHFVIVARSLQVPFPNLKSKLELTIHPFEAGDLAMVRQIDRPSEAKLCAQRLAQGDRGLMALYHSEPAGYAWGSVDLHTKLERVHPHLEPGDVLCTDGYTSPRFRGNGIQTTLTLARMRLFQELGYRRALSTIAVDNGPSLAVWQRKLNAQPIGTIDFLRIGPWYRVRYG